MKWWVLPTSFWLLFGCITSGDHDLDPYSPNFNTTDASELYFKNVRQYYYDLEEQDGQNMFSLGNRNQEASYPNLILIITMDWRKDQAYLSLASSPYFSEDSPIEVQALARERDEHHKLVSRDKVETFAFVTKIYQSILNEQKLYVLIDDKQYPLFANESDREAFRITAFDFYRLVGLQ
ncbi:MAG: hypothetical protein ACR2MX_03145 [Cyclobacteriaceae bacterium]